MNREAAEVRTPQGQQLARGAVTEQGDGRLDFSPSGEPAALLRYFFLNGRRDACLQTDPDSSVPVRLDTRWAGGCRRWTLRRES